MPAYLSMLENSHRDYAIGHWLKSIGIIDKNVEISKLLNFHFQLCSIETSLKKFFLFYLMNFEKI